MRDIADRGVVVLEALLCADRPDVSLEDRSVALCDFDVRDIAVRPERKVVTAMSTRSNSATAK